MIYTKQDQVTDWRERQVRASRRVDTKQYGYCDPQEEEDGLSCASIEDELGEQERELEQQQQCY